METSGDHAVRTSQLKVLLPSSFHKLHISEELARHFDAGGGEARVARRTALLVSPFGVVCRVEVGRDGDGAFLGSGWPEFIDRHGIRVGWFLVLRHQGGGLLTVKAFDTSCCLKEFCTPSIVTSSRSSRDALRKPQFIRVLLPNFVENMLIPEKFVQLYITESELNSQKAIIFSPLGKFWSMELKRNQSGVFFAGGWSEFLAFHGISEYDVVLLRHEGNMLFKIKVFGPNGCLKDLKEKDIRVHQTIEKQQQAPCSVRKRKSKIENSNGQVSKKMNKTYSDHEIGPPSWIKKEINAYSLQRGLVLPSSFCKSVGFDRSCTMTLKTSSDSAKCWEVRGLSYLNGSYLSGDGWNSFCKENKLKEGDMCTFHIVENALWHVVIDHA